MRFAHPFVVLSEAPGSDSQTDLQTILKSKSAFLYDCVIANRQKHLVKRGRNILKANQILSVKSLSTLEPSLKR